MNGLSPMQGMRDLAELARELARRGELDTQLQLVCDRLCAVEGLAHTAITITGLHEQPMLFVSRGIPEALERVAVASASMPEEAIRVAMPELKLHIVTIEGPQPGDRGKIFAFLDAEPASQLCQDAMAGAAGLVHLCVGRHAAAIARRSELRRVEALLENMHNIMVYQGTPGDGPYGFVAGAVSGLVLYGAYARALRRVRIGPLSDRRLKPGEWRELTDQEIAALRRASRRPPAAASPRAGLPR